MNADTPLVTQVIPTSNFFPGREGMSPKWIILHGTAGGSSARAIANFYVSTQGGTNPVSSHYVIGQDGAIAQCVLERDGAWANGFITQGHDSWWSSAINPNNQTISIEHVKDTTDNSALLTFAQKRSSFLLISDICHRLGIPITPASANGGITGHYSLDPVNRSRCPGAYPWADLWASLGGVPKGWRDDGTTLTAPNNMTVILGFRSYILHNAWSPDNLPQENEYGTYPRAAILHRKDLGPGTRQVFRDNLLWWTASTGVVNEAYLGLELDAAYKEIH